MLNSWLISLDSDSVSRGRHRPVSSYQRKESLMSSKHRLSWALLALILGLSLMVFGCSSDDDDNPTDPGGGGGGTDGVGSISGVITDQNGIPRFGATVGVNAQTATSNEQGYFVLTAVAEGSQIVTFYLDGYMSTFRVAEIVEGQSVHFGEIVLVLVESGTVQADVGGRVATGDGDGEVEFEADSFVDGAGNVYDGEVTVQLNAVLPDDDEFYGTFPGEFEGVREDGETVVPFVSFGFMTVEMMSESKAPLQLADGVTAALSLTIPEDKAMTAPATIPMWYFDETTGQWMEEGEATLDGNVYTADVAHFTTWNWDLPVDDICSITGVVVNSEGNPVSGARVVSSGVDVAIMDEVFTNSAGEYNVRAVKNSQTNVWAVSGSQASEAVLVSVGEECPLVLDIDLVLQVSAYTISLTWGETPSDLDSRFYIPMTWSTEYDYYHIYFGNQGTFGQNPFAQLDTDDTTSYGPEIITGTRLYEGRFQYWVHNWSGNDSAALQASGAVVQLEVAGGLWLFEAIDVPLEGADPSGWWHVCDFVNNGGTVTVESVMEFQPQLTEGYTTSGKEVHIK